MNGFSWLSFIFCEYRNWRMREDTCIGQKDKKTLEALANALAGRVPEKYQKKFRLKFDSYLRLW